MINPRRLAAGAAVLALLLVPTYFFLLRAGGGGGSVLVSDPTVLQTPPSQSTARVGLEAGQLAPDFEVSTVDGRRVRLSDFRGRPVVIDFFALWCGSCLAEMPHLKAAQEARGLDSFAVLALDAGETRDRAMDFVDFIKAPFTYGLDTNLSISDLYRVRGLPASVFIDSQGVVQATYAGTTDDQHLNAFLDAAIQAKPPGDLPLVLRLVNDIPRDRVLEVEQPSNGQVKLSSRSLRCDAGFCGVDAVVQELQAVAGVSVSRDDQATNPSLTVSFDPARMTGQQVVDIVVQALDAQQDPVYQGPVQVQHDPG